MHERNLGLGGNGQIWVRNSRCTHRRQVELGMTRKFGPAKKQDNLPVTMRDIRNTRAIEFEQKAQINLVVIGCE
jgi:hypothetical protein